MIEVIEKNGTDLKAIFEVVEQLMKSLKIIMANNNIDHSEILPILCLLSSYAMVVLNDEEGLKNFMNTADMTKKFWKEDKENIFGLSLKLPQIGN